MHVSPYLNGKEHDRNTYIHRGARASGALRRSAARASAYDTRAYVRALRALAPRMRGACPAHNTYMCCVLCFALQVGGTAQSLPYHCS